MSNSNAVQLEAAQPKDAGLLSNLVQLYAYDLSEIYQLSPGADGRFFYDKLPLYWSQPETRFPLLIRNGSEVAGFALVTRGSPVSDDPCVYDVAEFFVLRRQRRFGVGREAAFLLWDRFPGAWTVRVSLGNAGGLAFWSRAVEDYTGHAANIALRANQPHDWKIFFLESRR